MGVPWISVLISPSAADARHLKVDVDEVVAPNRKKVITASVDPVSEESLIPSQWNVPRAPAEQSAGGVIKPSDRPVPMQKGPSPAGGTGIGAATQQVGRITDRLIPNPTDQNRYAQSRRVL